MLINVKNPHGGDIYTNKNCLDFSSNVMPFGIPKAVFDAAANSLSKCVNYPDPYCRDLRKKLSAYENVSENYIICGNGAAELIYSFAYSLPKDKPALIVSPTFCEYRTALNAAGIVAKHYLLDEKNDFRFDNDILNIDFSKYSAIFICTPNNPTGLTLSPTLLVSLAEKGVKLFVDMCYLDLTDSPKRYNTPYLIQRYPNVVILKAFTKSFAISGLRLGYLLCSDQDFLRTMSEKAPCWNVSIPAQAAGYAALDCKDWLDDSVKVISFERERVAKTIGSFGIKVFKGEANYLLLYSETDLYGLLLKKNIIVRDCSNYFGLKKGYVRIAIRTPEENDRILSAIKEVLK